MEAAHKNAQSLKGTEFPVHKVGQSDHTAHGSGRATSSIEPAGGKVCYRCGRTGHLPRDCRFKDTTCHTCGKRGHIAVACRSSKRELQGMSRGRGPGSKAHYVDNYQHSDEPGIAEHSDVLNQIGSSTASPPYEVVMEINGKNVKMEIDTGAAVSIISSKTQQALFPDVTMSTASLILRSVTSEPVPLLGQLTVQVKYREYVGKHTLYVVEGNAPCLLGRDWLQKIRLNWPSIRTMSVHNSLLTLQQLTQKYAEVFQPELGTIKGFEAHLHLRDGAKPQFRRPRSVPFAIKESVGREIDRLVENGTLQPVEHSEWAAPIVPVPKKDGTIRICGDFKVTVNPYLDVDQHPLPKPTELFACLTGGKRFTKLDLSSAYQQLLLDEESSKLVAINTQKGLFRFTRLPFGVASAPAVFQRTMDTILQGVPQVICYLDDILITGQSDAEHMANLETVLKRLKEHGVRLNKDKCQFFEDAVEYLGHRVDAQGVHTSAKKLKAILEAPKPRNVQELRSFLGLINYYGKFLPNLATMLHPLNVLLRNGQPWRWSQECTRAFQEAKRKLTEAPVLVHFDAKLPLRLAGDASAYGVGAVISHVMPDGSEHPIAFASHTLSPSERNYSQVEKEALSLIFGVRKFHQYLYGRHFTIVTDHKPLTTILGPKQGIPALAAARMQRWALLLSAYAYDIQFRPTGLHGNADGLSRLPLLESSTPSAPDEASMFNVAQMQSLPISSSELEAATRNDPMLSKVLRYVRQGWPQQVPERLYPYWLKRNELTVEGDTILWGIRVVVPVKLRVRILDELHQGHPGVVRMKALARSYVWWPALEEEVEKQAKACSTCLAVKSAPVKAPLHPWEWPAVPWQRIHLDFLGPFMGKTLLVAVDSHSKWPEVLEMNTTSAAKTVTVLREMFARYGLPEQVVTDNGP